MSPRIDDARIPVIHQVASVLLGYPDEELYAARPVLAEAVAGLGGGPAAVRLGAFLACLDATPRAELAAHYVAVFDFKRRCCPYLTYYTCGDTRRRGMALLRFKHAYRAAGFEIADGELPDHLAVVCELSGRGAVREPCRRVGQECIDLPEQGDPAVLVEMLGDQTVEGPPDHRAVEFRVAEDPVDLLREVLMTVVADDLGTVFEEALHLREYPGTEQGAVADRLEDAALDVDVARTGAREVHVDAALTARLQHPHTFDDLAPRQVPAAAIGAYVEALGQPGHYLHALGASMAEADHIRRQIGRTRDGLRDEAAVDAEGEVERIVDAGGLVHR